MTIYERNIEHAITRIKEIFKTEGSANHPGMDEYLKGLLYSLPPNPSLMVKAGESIWIPCPVCNVPDTHKITCDEHGEKLSLIYCTNHECRSNGGTNIKGILPVDENTIDKLVEKYEAIANKTPTFNINALLREAVTEATMLPTKKIVCLFCHKVQDYNTPESQKAVVEHAMTCEKSIFVKTLKELEHRTVIAEDIAKGEWGDAEDQWTKQILLANPMEKMPDDNTPEDWKRYEIAMDMVRHRNGKYEIVDLVNWLLCRADTHQTLAAHATKNRNRFCSAINKIAALIGMKVENASPDAVVRNVKQIVENQKPPNKHD